MVFVYIMIVSGIKREDIRNPHIYKSTNRIYISHIWPVSVLDSD